MVNKVKIGVIGCGNNSGGYFAAACTFSNIEIVACAVIFMVTSFDVWCHSNHFIEIHGTEGSLQVPDPTILTVLLKFARLAN
jgi:predicted dehydrogenase